MIKCDKGTIEFEGIGTQILSELATLVHELHYSILIGKCDATPEQSKADILEAVELGFKSDEEIQKDAKDALKGMLTELADLLKDVLIGKDDK